jgi:polyisoprenoid-binding protein YceI
MIPHLLGTLVLVLGATATAQAFDWEADAATSTLGFVGSAQGEDFSGEFGVFDASIRFDPDRLESARFAVDIDLRSADTRNSERDETLQSADFFRTRREPMARYLAEQFRRLDDGRYAADGELTLRGITHPVTLEFSFSDGSPAVLEGEAILDRTAFDVGGGEWANDADIRHAVRVVTRLELERID